MAEEIRLNPPDLLHFAQIKGSGHAALVLKVPFGVAHAVKISLTPTKAYFL
jgi:hypothetical protein